MAESLRVFASREYLTINMEADDFARIESVESYGAVKDVIFKEYSLNSHVCFKLNVPDRLKVNLTIDLNTIGQLNVINMRCQCVVKKHLCV